ncbi:CLAVATA3/ESR (CLE)-related protein 2-B-like [Miscanthus floridulus]|uniref:CLAVATA3/ESR (CLE)-related protein 2-B-like n=1 Tax=Miscanthus floridulus TaxID=154761 RepID=UPI0034588D8E
MASRMATVAMAAFLFCALFASWTTTAEAARMGRQTTGDVVAVAAAVNGGGGGSGNVAYWERQQRGLVVGRRPTLASFTPRDDGAGGNKREVPSGPDPIHHGDAPLTSAAPTSPREIKTRE